MQVEVPVRSLLLIVMPAAVACADDPKPPPAPPRVYALEELTWAHPAMGVMVKRMAKHVAERHPEWVWNALEETPYDIDGGWTEEPKVRGLIPDHPRRGGGKEGLWLKLQLDKRATPAQPLIGDVDVYLRAVASNGFDVELDLSIWNGNTPRVSGRAAVSFRFPTKGPESSGVNVLPSIWLDTEPWNAWLANRHASRAPQPGLHRKTTIGIDTLAYALSGPGPMQEIGIASNRAREDIFLHSPEYRYNPKYKQRGMSEILENLRCPIPGGPCRDLDPEPIYAWLEEAHRMEYLEGNRADLTVLQLQRDALYAALLEIVPADLPEVLREATLAAPAP